MSEQNQPQLGRLCDESCHRDAVHIAIAPVVAEHVLQPGDHVGLDEYGRAVLDKTPIGVVDPFLPTDTLIQRDQTFWLCLYPGTVTSIRHAWQHPAFKPPSVKQAEEALRKIIRES